MRIPVFTQLGKDQGSARRTISDQDIQAMRAMGKRATVAQVAAAFPHVSANYVRRVLNGQARGGVVCEQQ